MLQACDVGHRVVVRRRVGSSAAGRDQFTDLLGTLVGIDDDRLLVRTEDGTDHPVALAEVTAAKRIPPRPARYSEIDALERVAQDCWPSPVLERLGDWYLRAAQGWTNRANSALPLGDPGRPLPEAAAAVVAWYHGHGLTPRITVPLPLRRDVADTLTTLGWYAQPLVLVQTAELAVLRDGDGPNRTVLLPAPSDRFLAIVAARKRSLPDCAEQVLTAPELVRFAERYATDGSLVGIARGAVVDGWLHLSVVEVVESARRQGIAGEVGRALAGWAAGVGATRAVLQVEEHNTGAVGLYGRLGFRTHHTYITYAAPAPAVSP